ncbi:nuclear transport factor 2 family protein [Microbacterium sp. cx-55]|uniref:nuclear transport factor 2 family protein n=1 Tax=Microbacterium sp. cx-55 TaxID=2875948 RepID=UPI001CC0735C|nr:nuclear transport factor 2 family protein [Microbacterium sp. cx-55]MBZ4487142.1 nuclear transport factor 2 family protein [Microbacterium sp. cx-55]UGB35175.1 nuclear transport factor 2 family protein [Microbacterium sp. cx-55]
MDESEVWFRAVKAAELELLDGTVRRDPVRVRELLHADFIEIGRSGRRWTRDETVAALASENEHLTPQTDEWSFIEVAPTLILVTYRITGTGGSSRHSSLWDVGGPGPVIRYHQGTVVPSEGAE